MTGQDIPNESPAKSTVGIAEKNWASGYNSDIAESSNRKGTNYIPPPPPLATGGCALSSKSESVAGTGTGSFFPPQYQTIKAKKNKGNGGDKSQRDRGLCPCRTCGLISEHGL
jgi:hypothetical protein